MKDAVLLGSTMQRGRNIEEVFPPWGVDPVEGDGQLPMLHSPWTRQRHISVKFIKDCLGAYRFHSPCSVLQYAIWGHVVYYNMPYGTV